MDFSENLNGKTVAFMVAAGFNETEFSELQRRLVKSGVRLTTIAAESGVVNGWQPSTASWGHYHPVDKSLADTLAADIDILVVPGGSKGIAKLSQNLHAKRILAHAVDGLVPVVLFGDATELLAAAERSADVNVMSVSDLSDENWTDSVLAHMGNDFFAAEEARQAA